MTESEALLDRKRDGGSSSDAEVIGEVLAGNQRAFVQLVERYEGVVAKTVINMLGPGDSADEAGQVAMIKVYKGLAGFRAEASFKTYVTRIAMNVALDEIRRQRRVWNRGFRLSADLPENTFERVPDAEDIAADHALRTGVRNALAKLKPDFRAVVVLRLTHGYSPTEVAAILNISEGTVFSRLSRARRQLQVYLNAEMNDD